LPFGAVAKGLPNEPRVVTNRTGCEVSNPLTVWVAMDPDLKVFDPVVTAIAVLMMHGFVAM